MEMKINLKQLFGAPSNQLNTTQETPPTPLEHSIRSLSDSFDYQLSLDPHLFPELSNDDESVKGSVGETSHQAQKGAKSQHSSNSVRPTQPGERLYYQSQANYLRKMKQRALFQEQKQAQIKKIPFAPAINKKSRQMAEKLKTEQSLTSQKQKKEEEKTSKQLKDQKELKQCTFQPKLISKTAKNITKSKEELFYMLHSASKIRQIRRQEKIDEEEKATKQQKKLPEKHFNDFLKRNQDFAEVSRKKLELLKQSASLYDFKTGEKLFSPKISESKGPHFFQNSSPKKTQISPKTNKSQKLKDFEAVKVSQPPKKSGIFSKKYPTYCPSYEQNNQQDSPKISEFPLASGAKELQKLEEEDYNEEYRKYSEQYDRLISMHEGSLSQQAIIVEESEKEARESEPSDWEQSSECVVVEDVGMWGSAEVSNVKQPLAGSEEDELEPRNNYVMDILSNLINAKAEVDEDQS